MAAKKGTLWFLLALVTLFASASAHATITRPQLNPTPLYRYELPADREPAQDPFSDPNARRLMAALDRAMPEPASVRRLVAARVTTEAPDALRGYDDAQHLRVFARVKPKLASGVLALHGETNVWQISRLEPELHWGEVFQAQPFAEPFTRKSYVRERWYDPYTGTWLTPDPLGYKDSSNLYAYAGGDPVNQRDPTGLQEAVEETEDEMEAAGIDPWTGRRVTPPRPGIRGPKGSTLVPGEQPGGDVDADGELPNAQHGPRALGGRTADQLDEKQQRAAIDRMRCKRDPKCAAQVLAIQIQLHPELNELAKNHPPPMLAVGGAGGGDDGGDEDGRGWTVGDPMTKLTRAGKVPSWNTQRARYWKNEAMKPGAEAKWGAENVVRMRRGVAPQRYNFATGAMESMELSHEPVPQREGGTEVVPRWPGQHAAVDPYRNTGNTRAIVRGNGQ